MISFLLQTACHRAGGRCCVHGLERGQALDGVINRWYGIRLNRRQVMFAGSVRVVDGLRERCPF